MSLTDRDREDMYTRLSAHAAAEHIDLDELERRVAVVHRAGSRDEAWLALDRLPALETGPGQAVDAGRPRWGHGHGEVDRAPVDWRPTGERFRDPKSGRVMRVWEDGGGGRHYVPEDGA